MFPEFSFLMWGDLAGWGRGGWQCWGAGAALGAALQQCLLSSAQGWAAGGSPCRCCWSTGRALAAQDKVTLLQITTENHRMVCY